MKTLIQIQKLSYNEEEDYHFNEHRNDKFGAWFALEGVSTADLIYRLSIKGSQYLSEVCDHHEVVRDLVHVAVNDGYVAGAVVRVERMVFHIIDDIKIGKSSESLEKIFKEDSVKVSVDEFFKIVDELFAEEFEKPFDYHNMKDVWKSYAKLAGA